MCTKERLNGTVHNFEGISFYCHKEPPTTWTEHCHDELQITLLPSAAAQATWQHNRDRQKHRITSGQVLIMPACQPHTIQWLQTAELMLFYIQPQFFTRAAQEAKIQDTASITAQCTATDPFIQQLGMAFRSTLQRNPEPGSLYLDSLATVLAVHLLDRYSIQPVQFPKDRLSKPKLDQVLDYIHSHLDQPIKLGDLARLLEISQYYFCRLFKRSVGIPPYQYVLQQRIERAKQLLRQPHIKIVDVALQCGFSNQSHLTKLFHQFTGITPKHYQDQAQKQFHLSS